MSARYGTISITNAAADVAEINIEGTIGIPAGWQFENPDGKTSTYDEFTGNLLKIKNINSKNVIVNIRSVGGDVNDALLIHDALAGLQGNVETRCFGYTASAATIVAQCGKRRKMSSNGLYLIHRSATLANGNALDLKHNTELLEETDARIAALYASRSGRGKELYESLMGENNGNGRWLSADEALFYGLIDEVIEPSKIITNEINVADYGLPALPINTMKMEKGLIEKVVDFLGLTEKVTPEDFAAKIAEKESEIKSLKEQHEGVIASANAENAALKEAAEQAAKEIAELKQSIAVKDEQIATLTEKRTIVATGASEPTNGVQDPTPQPQVVKTENQTAYERDLEALRG